jgi:hypothetical protein
VGERRHNTYNPLQLHDNRFLADLLVHRQIQTIDFLLCLPNQLTDALVIGVLVTEDPLCPGIRRGTS